MTPGKGTKHQAIIGAEAFGEGQGHHALQSVLERVEARYNTLDSAEAFYRCGTMSTADTGFANGANLHYLHQRPINGYLPEYRSRDAKYAHRKPKYGKRHQGGPCTGWQEVMLASDFQFDPCERICLFPGAQGPADDGKIRAHSEGRLLHCRHGPKQHRCMQYPACARNRKGAGRRVAFTLEDSRAPSYAD